LLAIYFCRLNGRHSAIPAHSLIGCYDGYWCNLRVLFLSAESRITVGTDPGRDTRRSRSQTAAIVWKIIAWKAGKILIESHFPNPERRGLQVFTQGLKWPVQGYSGRNRYPDRYTAKHDRFCFNPTRLVRGPCWSVYPDKSPGLYSIWLGAASKRRLVHRREQITCSTGHR
jgi:hypothetical protein